MSRPTQMRTIILLPHTEFYRGIGREFAVLAEIHVIHHRQARAEDLRFGTGGKKIVPAGDICEVVVHGGAYSVHFHFFGNLVRGVSEMKYLTGLAVHFQSPMEFHDGLMGVARHAVHHHVMGMLGFYTIGIYGRTMSANVLPALPFEDSLRLVFEDTLQRAAKLP